MTKWKVKIVRIVNNVKNPIYRVRFFNTQAAAEEFRINFNKANKNIYPLYTGTKSSYLQAQTPEEFTPEERDDFI